MQRLSGTTFLVGSNLFSPMCFIHNFVFTAQLSQAMWHTNSCVSQLDCVKQIDTQTPTFHSLTVSNKLTHKLLHFTAWLCQSDTQTPTFHSPAVSKWHTNSYISQPSCVKVTHKLLHFTAWLCQSDTQTPTFHSPAVSKWHTNSYI